MEHKQDLAIGGQALIEGVMIRSHSAISIAVRKPDGSITVKKRPFTSLTKRVKIFGLPVIRGVVNLFEMMIIGMQALNFSAQEAFEEEENGEAKAEAHSSKEKTRAQKTFEILSFGFSIILSLALAIFIFKFIPLLITEQLKKVVPALANSVILFNLTDGIIRITLFFLYILILSMIPAFRRVFEYHGAEHKAVFAYEKSHALTIENIKKESPRHPRCGTSFIMIVLILSIFFFSLVPRDSDFLINFLRRLAIIPLIAGASYEVLKFTAKYRKNAFVDVLTYPGILTQYITTKEPDEKQIEVAIAAVQAAVE